MEKDNEMLIKELQEKIKLLENEIKDLKNKLKTHRHDGHGYTTI